MAQLFSLGIVRMKRNIILIALAGILCASLTGCGTIPSYEDLGGGYVEAKYIRTSWEPTAMRFELRYRKGWRTVKIWPDTLGIHVKDGVALFTAYAASREPDPDEASRPMS